MRSVATILVSILLATACAGATDLPEFPFVCTSGKAVLKIQPDLATISFDVSIFDADSEQGMKLLEEHSKQIVQIMNEFDVAAENAKASGVNKEEVRKQIGEWQEGEIIGYQFGQHFTFKLKGLDTYQKIAQRLVKTDNVINVRVGFAVTDREQKEQELVQKAIVNARENAARIARGAGAGLGAVHALSDVDLRDLGRHLLYTVASTGSTRSRASGEHGMGGAALDASAIIQQISKPSPITLQASIRVLYRIESADPS